MKTAVPSQPDLFGEPNTSPEPVACPSKRRHKTQPRGYAAPPGTGPQGKTCADCVHIARRKLGKTYIKCGLAHERWTGGPATDILAGAAACKYFQAPIGFGRIHWGFNGPNGKPARPDRVKIISRTETSIETDVFTFTLVDGVWKYGVSGTTLELLPEEPKK